MFPVTFCVEVIISLEFFYICTAEFVEMAVNKSPFPTRLNCAISFNVLILTRLLGSNNSNSKVTPLQTPIASSFILT